MTAPSVPAGDVAKLVERARHAARVERTLSGTNAGSLHDELAAALESLSRDLAEARAAIRCAQQQCETAVYNLSQREHDEAIVRSFQSIADFCARSVLSTQGDARCVRM